MTAENTKFQISNTNLGNNKLSEREKFLRNSVNLTPVNLNQILNYIDHKIEDPVLKGMVIKRARSYPHSALEKFFNIFDSVVQECQKKIHEMRLKENGKTLKKIEEKQADITNDDLLELQKSFEDASILEDHDDKF